MSSPPVTYNQGTCSTFLLLCGWAGVTPAPTLAVAVIGWRLGRLPGSTSLFLVVSVTNMRVKIAVTTAQIWTPGSL